MTPAIGTPAMGPPAIPWMIFLVGLKGSAGPRRDAICETECDRRRTKDGRVRRPRDRKRATVMATREHSVAMVARSAAKRRWPILKLPEVYPNKTEKTHSKNIGRFGLSLDPLTAF